MKKTFIALLIWSFVIFTPAFAFSDVPEEFWAYEKIQEMHNSGLISGFEDGTFRPNSTLTREQAAAVMTNFFELSPNGKEKAFEDVVNGYWSEPYVNLVGKFMPVDEIDGKYYFRPSENATRIEVAEAIIEIIGYNNQEIDYSVVEKFVDKDNFSENDKKYIALAVNNKIMAGDDKAQFRPNDTITRAEFCALIYNVYLMREELKEVNADEVVITVNGQAVSREEFILYFNLQKAAYESVFGTSDIWGQEIEGVTLYEILKETTRSSIVDNKVMIQKANEMGIKLSDEEKAELEEYVNSDVGSEICAFYNITPEQLYKINSEGLLSEELIKAIYSTLDHSQHEHVDITQPVDTITYDARHILLSTVDLDEEAKNIVKEKAEGLLKRINSGEDFATLAKEYSEDLGSKDNGGLYEDVALGEFVAEFETVALALNPGAVYHELVETSYGYHIIKLEAKKPTQRELTDEEKLEIMNQDMQSVVLEWVNNSVIEENEEIYKAI